MYGNKKCHCGNITTFMATNCCILCRCDEHNYIVGQEEARLTRRSRQGERSCGQDCLECRKEKEKTNAS